MKSMKKRRFTILLFLLTFAAIFSINSFAAGKIDTNKDVSLTIHYVHDSKGIADAKFFLYKVAEVNSNGEYKISADFSSYPVYTEGLDQDGWEELAETLAGYALRDKLPAVDNGKTDSNGILSFPTGSKKLKTGLYLLVGEPISSEGNIYTPKSSIVSLPTADKNETWMYDVSVLPKYEMTRLQKISRKVLKVWSDKDNANVRPSEVVVQLLKNGNLYDTVTLNPKNNWRHEWIDLDNQYGWTLVEKEVRNYTTTVELKGGTFTVTNTYAGPQKPTYGNETDNTAGKSTSENKTTTRTSYSITTGKGGSIGVGQNTTKYNNNNSYATTAHNITTGSNKTPSGSNKLPQTGLLWWPVSVLAIAGLAMIMIGFIRNRNEMDEK